MSKIDIHRLLASNKILEDQILPLKPSSAKARGCSETPLSWFSSRCRSFLRVGDASLMVGLCSSRCRSPRKSSRRLIRALELQLFSQKVLGFHNDQKGLVRLENGFL